MEKVLLNLKEVLHLTGLSKSTLYMFMEEGLFPRPKMAGKKVRLWPKVDVDHWIAHLPDEGKKN